MLLDKFSSKIDKYLLIKLKRSLNKLKLMLMFSVKFERSDNPWKKINGF